MKFIELTQVTVTTGGASGGASIIVNTDHIIHVAPGKHGTCVIQLDSDEVKRISVSQTYDQIKGLLKV